MRKILSLLLTLAFVFTAKAQSDSGQGYDPSNPGDPQAKVFVGVEADPPQAGYVYGGGWVEPGSEVCVQAYPRDNAWKFDHWIIDTKDEELLSKIEENAYDSSFCFNIADKAVHLTAHFKYEPDSPVDPPYTAPFHYLYLSSSPRKGGYTYVQEDGNQYQTSKYPVEVGKSVVISAWANEQFRFSCWKKDGKIVSTERELAVTMVDESLYYTAQFVYDPASPGNPRPNKYNPATGELIIDDFDPGNLTRTIERTIEENIQPGETPDPISYVKIVGRVGNYDSYYWWNVPELHSANTLDISRLSGITEVSGYNLSEFKELTYLWLSSEIQNVEYDIFSHSEQLSRVYIYAETPPGIWNNSYFTDVQSDMAVYVPYASVDLYKNATGWQDLNILPMGYETGTLVVRLPVDPAASGAYSGMTIVLTDEGNGQERKLLVGSHDTYTFNNLVPGVTYAVRMYTSRGQVSAADMVTLQPKEVMELNLGPNPLLPVSTTLSVVTPEGKDVTSLAAVTWKSADGKEYYCQGATLDNMLEGSYVAYEISLPESLAKTYVKPSLAIHMVQKGKNPIFKLEKIKKYGCLLTIGTDKTGGNSGAMRVASSGLEPVGGVGVTAYQDIDGKYGWSATGISDEEGHLTIPLLAGFPARLTFKAEGFLSMTEEISAEELTPSPEAAASRMRAPGYDEYGYDYWAEKEYEVYWIQTNNTVRKVNMTFRHKHLSESYVSNPYSNGYDDITNVAFTLDNLTTGESVQTDWQNPSMYILAGVAAGDKVRITATSLNNSFVTVSEEFTASASGTDNVTMTFADHGAVRGYFQSPHDFDIIALVYDCNGDLVARDRYNSNDKFQIEGLPAGEYSLVSIADNPYVKSASHLSDLTAMKLEAGTDYALNAFSVAESIITQLNVGIDVPAFDEDKFSEDKFIKVESSLTVNKTGVVVGNYVTLRCRYDIQQDDLSGIVLHFEMPDDCNFVTGSLLGIKPGTAYTYRQNERGKWVLEIPVEDDCLSGDVRFCVEPRVGGDYRPDGYVTFRTNSTATDSRQPLGAAWFNAKEFEVLVPAVTAYTTVHARGTARDVCNITVYDNGKPVGQCVSQPSGDWCLHFELADIHDGDPYPEIHRITADVYDPRRDRHYPATASSVIYDPEYPEQDPFTMIHDGTFVKFDHNTGKTTPKSYTYNPDRDLFTFQAQFVENIERVDSVRFLIHASDGTVREMEGVKMPTPGRWACAIGYPDASRLPVNVTCRFVYRKDKKVEEPWRNPMPVTVRKMAPDVVPVIDPSGFVYEAVESNRVEGVRCTVFYREMRENMYGDVYWEVMKWDAEQYAQENPLFTDSEGCYRWDVPQGEWQVLFEKDGYESARSEWLPVPPPQLEVNIGLVRYSAPEVTGATAFEEGVEFQFDRMMDISSVVSADEETGRYINAVVLDGYEIGENGEMLGEYAEGSIEALDAVSDPEGREFASKFRYNPDESLKGPRVALTISGSVESCHGVAMSVAFIQDFEVEAEPTAIIFSEDADMPEITEETPVSMSVDSRRRIFVKVEPAEAGAGKTIELTPTTPGVVEISVPSVVLDENGEGEIYLDSSLPGYTDIKGQVTGYSLNGSFSVQVLNDLLIRGDVDHDKVFTANDLALALAFSFGENPDNGIFEAADVNRDDLITISDVTSVIYLALSQGEASLDAGYLELPSIAGYDIDGGMLKLHSPVDIMALQFELPAGSDAKTLDIAEGIKDKATMRTGLTPSGSLRVIVYANDTETPITNVADIVKVGQAEVSNLLVSSCDYRLTRASGEISAVGSMIQAEADIMTTGEGIAIVTSKPGIAIVTTPEGIARTFAVASGRSDISLSQGVYVVECNGARAKVIVK